MKINSGQSTQPFTFLVLADIHFGELADSPEFKLDEKQRAEVFPKRLSRRSSLVSTVLNLPDKPTAIFVPGDLTSIASPGEFEGCVRMTTGIAAELGISPDNIFFTYGNHDTNWRICELGNETNKFPADTNYEHVAATIGGLYTPLNNIILKGPVIGSGVFQVHNHILFILNSGSFCVAEQAYKHGRLGTEQLEWFANALEKYKSHPGWKLLMVHHHPFNYTYPSPIEDVSCIEEGAEVVELAGRFGIDLLCHGHRHHPRIFTDMRTGWMNPMTFICAGSVAVNPVHRDSGLIPNLFHVVSLQKRLGNRSAFGNTTTFEFTTEGWKPVRNTAATPLDHVQWFGSLVSDAETDIAVNSFLQSTLSANPENPLMLPARETLPPELMCCSLDHLNKRLSKLAQGFGYRVVGKYPDDVSLQKAH